MRVGGAGAGVVCIAGAGDVGGWGEVQEPRAESTARNGNNPGPFGGATISHCQSGIRQRNPGLSCFQPSSRASVFYQWSSLRSPGETDIARDVRCDICVIFDIWRD